MAARILSFRAREFGTESGPPRDGNGYRILSGDDIARLYADTPDSRTRRFPRRRARRHAVLVVGVVLALVLAFAIPTLLQWYWGSVSGNSTTASPTPSSARPATPAPSALSWQRFQGVSFPVSAVDGPRVLTSAEASGFSGSDRGAALAAVHIVYRASVAPGPSVFEPTLARQVAGPGAAQLTETVRADYQQARQQLGLDDGAPLPDGFTTFLGYRVSAMPDGNRAVQIVEEAPDTNGLVQPFALDVVVTRTRDSDGLEDWKVVAPTGGSWADTFSQLASVPGDLVPFTDSSQAGGA